MAARTRPPLPPPPPPPDPSRKAVELFERGFRALQQRDYAKAAEILASLVTSYPDEKELHERARVFLAICERQAAAAPQPQTLEERVCAATLAINRGETGQALRMLADLAREHPDHDHVHYLLAIAHGAAGHTGDAVAHLRRAIELRPSNRVLAGQDADLEALRDDPGFHALLNGSR
ncbi:MAG TPA: tetratricopeptide repeat protein [Vicinamibacterales bacterium]|nr:tetratricopeptide repeat protein [Acidobacteriota bacterium]HOC19035.1 tetratricopeptide repeat protein [Vicinamibacterales bacterium]